MADKLTEMYDDWYGKQTDDVGGFSTFQAGFTMAAVSMRTRAMAACDKTKDVNKIKNSIGSLSDIPE